MAKFVFDASKVAPQQPRDPVPNGKYVVIITESDVVATKTRADGTRLTLTAEIVEGEYKGRHIWDGLNTKNANKIAEDIGQSQLSALCHAIGVVKMADTAELHGKPFLLKVKLVPARHDEKEGKDFDAKNEMQGFEPLGGAGAVTASAPTSASGAAPSWAAGKGAVAPATPPPEVKPPVAVIDPEAKFWISFNNAVEEVKAKDIQELLDASKARAEELLAMRTDETEWRLAAQYGFVAVVAQKPAPPAPPTRTPPAPPTPPKPGGKAPWQK